VRLVPPASCAALALSSLVAAQLPTRPDVHLGHALGADFELPDWGQVRGYFAKLDQESARVTVSKVGTTTEGRDFVLAVITSETNHAQLDQLKRYAAICHDPRGRSPEEQSAALEHGKPIVFISCAMHATECASPQFAMQFAWELATSDEEPYRSARENCVVLLAPSLNPDGLDHVVEWYRRTVHTPYENAELPKLYQYYCGHDNNRDWFALTQAETRIVTRLLYHEWRPQVYWDVHQQGSTQERLFVPPFRDPLDPNLDPGMVCGMNLLGTRAQFDLTREGKTGVATGGTYDMWWNGGNRNVPVRHNIVGLLTEAASAQLASPLFVPLSRLSSPTGAKEYRASNAFPAPWPGGWWRIGDIIAYELAFGRSLLGSLARERRFWLANQLEAAGRTVRGEVPGAPAAWVIPATNAERGATLRLADILLQSGVELDAAQESFTLEGRSWPAGSLVIQAAQPYMRHVKDLFEVQEYPQGDPPYDVAGWTLPALFGVDAAELHAPVGAKLARLKDLAAVEKALGEAPANGLGLRDSAAWKRVFASLAQGERWHVGQDKQRRAVFAAGAAPSGGVSSSSASDSAPNLSRLPRIGVVAPWSGSMDEGWMRWVFDSFGLKFATLRYETLRAGDLRSLFDVIVLPSLGERELDHGRAEGSVFDELAGGLDPEGAIAVEEFVRGGGTLVATGSACDWTIGLFKLGLTETTTGAEAKDFSCPGSVLRTIPEASEFTAGLDDSVAIFGSNPKAWKVAGNAAEVLLRYAPTRTLISGYLMKPEALAGQAAWVRATHGQGAVHLFGFRPHYRGWSQAAFQLLFRALLFERRGA